MSAVQLRGVAKSFAGTGVVRDISLDIADGELVALLGPSGSGKTTLLRLIAGFEHADAGTIHIGGDDVTTWPAVRRRCGMVFQHYALFPHLTVAGNVGYGLADQALTRDAARARIAEVLAMVDLSGLGDRPVTALSGGQQQRVALARALAPRPRVLLLDEPLSNLDPSLRERTRRELRDVVTRVGITTVLVTHEQEEAFDLADRIALLHQGTLQQVGTAEALYHDPATPFVAGFIGRASSVNGRVVERHGGRVLVDAVGTQWWATATGDVPDAVTIMIRPEALEMSSDGLLHGKVVSRRFAGASSYFGVALGDGTELEVLAPSDAARIGEPTNLRTTGAGVHAFAARA